MPQTTITTYSATAPDDQPSRRRGPRRAGRTLLVAFASLALLFLLFPLAANAAMTTFAAHDHGDLEIVIDGQLLDLDQPRYHDLHPEFHLHEGYGNRFHHHPTNLAHLFRFEPLTLRQAFDALGMPLRGRSITIDGITYDDADPTTSVTLTVDGTEVEVDRFIITDGIVIRVEVTTN